MQDAEKSVKNTEEGLEMGSGMIIAMIFKGLCIKSPTD